MTNPDELVSELKNTFGEEAVRYHDDAIYLRGEQNKQGYRPAILVIRISQRGGAHVQIVSASLPLITALRKCGVELETISLRVKT